ncbi:GNAT family N-acetyltransferase [Kribbella sp. ALI-6-A]|uniref:GNAT family N-acetyltransferase n=1 Tax=Kribbella sp. ALI-6-A TaxID=1933817 RepID=UPI00097CB788|nr:GNAT family N-acetyltransferase [Kribbella sp. ALI-6-A]ONI77664.1 GNAT family N-acetyltransferase [Kribbella sp. ALI-6-A]
MSAPDLTDLTPSTSAADQASLAAAASAGVHVRMLTELSELEGVYRLYDSIWRPDPKNPPVTTELLRALTKAGNYVSGAYDGDELIGACVGFFSAPAEVAMHSHVAGVSGRARGRHVGFALKLHQRAWALRRGITAISWTFDPLVRRNAYFNLCKLAAEPAEYLTNFYGDMHDGINNGDDTDRLLVRWQLESPAVAKAATGHPPGPTAKTLPEATVALSRTPDDHPTIHSSATSHVPGATSHVAGASTGLGDRVMLVAVPADIEGLRHTAPAAAKAWRAALREVLGGLLVDGWQVTGFDRTGWYVLELPARGLLR